ncbi:MAG: hypothetical protein R3301_04370 [Saprospiraceae bacterium]|nr:hypothetical protein [Saprospiraceae bacterium]
MSKWIFGLLCAVMAWVPAMSQTDTDNMKLPYEQIPDHPDVYRAGTIAARMVDGLGFRYYWATEGLRDEDLSYKPSAEGRTTMETLDHIYGLTRTLRNAVERKVNDSADPRPQLDFAAMRKATLENIQVAADILRQSSDEDFDSFEIVFKRGERTSEFPFWNMLNGPLADALWHTGQVVLLRRASGNPFPSGVSVFSGRKRN